MSSDVRDILELNAGAAGQSAAASTKSTTVKIKVSSKTKSIS